MNFLQLIHTFLITSTIQASLDLDPLVKSVLPASPAHRRQERPLQRIPDIQLDLISLSNLIFDLQISPDSFAEHKRTFLPTLTKARASLETALFDCIDDPRKFDFHNFLVPVALLEVVLKHPLSYQERSFRRSLKLVADRCLQAAILHKKLFSTFF